jgi:hypothetical protein
MDSPQGGTREASQRSCVTHSNDVRKELGSTPPSPFTTCLNQISSLAAASTIPVTNAVAQANIRRSSKTLVMARSPARRLLTPQLR